jgi:hypothetical protein
MSIRNKGKVIFHFVESDTEKRFSLIMLPDRKSLREKGKRRSKQGLSLIFIYE